MLENNKKRPSTQINIKKTASASMEFFMTYMWGLIVILIVISAFLLFDLTNPERLLPDKVDIGPEFTVTDAELNQNSITFILKNNLHLNLLDFLITVESCNNGKGSLGFPVFIKSGEIKKITIYCPNRTPSGKKFKSIVVVNYNTKEYNSDPKFSHVVNGYLHLTATKGTSELDPFWAMQEFANSSYCSDRWLGGHECQKALDGNWGTYAESSQYTEPDAGNPFSYDEPSNSCSIALSQEQWDLYNQDIRRSPPGIDPSEAYKFEECDPYTGNCKLELSCDGYLCSMSELSSDIFCNAAKLVDCCMISDSTFCSPPEEATLTAQCEGSYFIATYDKPEWSTSQSKWRVKDNEKIIELNIDETCWDVSPLEFKAVHHYENQQSYWYCSNGNTEGNKWVLLRQENIAAGSYLYEEAMHWYIQPNPN